MPPTELERLYDAHSGALYAFGLSLTRDETDTRDLLQDVFIRLARQPELLRGVRDERGYLLRLLHHATVDLIRRRDARRRAHDGLAGEPAELFAPTEDPDETAFRDGLSAGLGELPEEQRSVVHLKLWEGFTFDHIAEILAISPNTAASRYRYGLDKLRTRLRPLYDELRQAGP